MERISKTIKLLFVMLLYCSLLISCNSEKKRYKQTLEQNTLGAYEAFIEEFPKSLYLDSAMHQIEEIKFDYAIKNQSVYELNEFKAKYPASRHLDSINTIIDRTMRLDLLGYLGYYDRPSDLRLIDGSNHKDQMLSPSGGVQFDNGTLVIHNYLKDKVSIFTIMGEGAQVAYIEDNVVFEYANGKAYKFENRDKQEYLSQRKKVEQIKKNGLTFETDVNGIEASATISGGAMNFGGTHHSVR